jgi:hypothetical protein
MRSNWSKPGAIFQEKAYTPGKNTGNRLYCPFPPMGKSVPGTFAFPMDAGHVEKLNNNIVGLQKALTSIQGSLQNKNLTQEARSILLNAESEAIRIIQRGTELLEGVK